MSLAFVYIKSHNNVILVGVDKDFWPMTYLTNEKFSGFEIDLAKEVFKNANLNYKFKAIDWSKKEELMNNGKIDCIWSGMSLNEDRLNTYSFTPIYLTSKSIIVTNNLPYTCINSLTDIKGKRIGIYVISSSAYYFSNSKYFDLVAEVKYYDSLDTLFTALQNNDIDAIVTDEIYALAKIKKNKQSYKILDAMLGSESFAVAFPLNKNKDVLLTVSNSINEAVKDGTIEELSQKWFGKDLHEKQSNYNWHTIRYVRPLKTVVKYSSDLK